MKHLSNSTDLMNSPNFKIKRGAPERGSRWSRVSTMLNSKTSLYRGGGGCMTANFQLLMLSPNLLKSQSLVGGGGGGAHDSQQLPTLDAESPNLLKSQSPVGGGGEGCMTANFQLLMLNPNLLKSQSPFTWGGGGEVKIQLPIFDAESKSAKI